MRKIFFTIIVSCFLCACASKTLPTQKQEISAQFLIISPLIKINDSGFIYFSKNTTKVQFYMAGSGLLELKIKDKICINSICYDKKDFNQKFFKKEYYPEILNDILHSKPIAGVKSTPNDCNGFVQKTSNFSYEVCSNKTSFIDNNVKLEFFELIF